MADKIDLIGMILKYIPLDHLDEYCKTHKVEPVSEEKRLETIKKLEEALAEIDKKQIH